MSLQPGIKKGYWSDAEDALLTARVEAAIAECRATRTTAKVSWPCVAAGVAGRSSKKCKERWDKHLRPDIYRGPFTPEEDLLILEAHDRMGSCWVKISALFQRRTAAMIRNRTHALLKLQKKRQQQQQHAPPAPRAAPLTALAPLHTAATAAASSPSLPVESPTKRTRCCESPTSTAVALPLRVPAEDKMLDCVELLGELACGGDDDFADLDSWLAEQDAQEQQQQPALDASSSSDVSSIVDMIDDIEISGLLNDDSLMSLNDL